MWLRYNIFILITILKNKTLTYSIKKKLIPHHLVTFLTPMIRKHAPDKSILKENMLSYSDDNLYNIFKIKTLYF